MERFTKDSARVTVWSVPWLGIAFALGVLSAASLAFASVAGGPIGAASLVFVLATLVAISRAFRDLDGKVETDADGVWLDGKLLVPRAALREGRAHAADRAKGNRAWHEAWAELRGPLCVVRVHAKDGREAEAALGPLGLSARHARAAYLFYPRSRDSRATAAGLVAIGAALVGRLVFEVLPALGAVLLAVGIVAILAFTRASASKVTVGADGLSLQEGRKRRFVPWSDVDDLRTDDEEQVVVHLRSGETLSMRPFVRRARAEMSRDFVLRAEAARAAAREHDEVGQSTSLLARGERPTGEWVAALRALGMQEGYRSMGLPRDRLLALVKDGTAHLVDRLAAAVALRGVLDDEERQRLRVVADASASPELGARIRVVLDADDDARVARALEEAEADADADAVADAVADADADADSDAVAKADADADARKRLTPS